MVSRRAAARRVPRPRKIVAGLVGTAGGVALLFSYHTSLNRPGATSTALGVDGGAQDPNGAPPTAILTPTASTAPGGAATPSPRATSAGPTATGTGAGTSPTPTTGDDERDDEDGAGGTTARGRTATRTRTAASTKPPTTTAARTTTTEPDDAGVTGTFTGAQVSTQWGPVQVRITVVDGRITAARAVAYPSSSPRSQEINAEALPVLNQAVVAAQSADIDAVSGATVTSQGYVQSLQSAIDQAGL